MSQEPSFMERVTEITKGIDERLEREKKADEIVKMTTTLSHVNIQLKNAKWTYKFINSVLDNKAIKSSFQVLKKEYNKLKDIFVKLEWDESRDIDILEPSPFLEPLNRINDCCSKFEEKIRDALMEEKNGIIRNRKMAESLSVIPEIKVNTETFDQALSFLNQIGENMRYIAGFVEMNDAVLKKKLEDWEKLKNKVVGERKKLDLKNLKAAMILSDATIDFLRKLTQDHKVIFTSLAAEAIDEVKVKFPDLSKKLFISIKVGE